MKQYIRKLVLLGTTLLLLAACGTTTQETAESTSVESQTSEVASISSDPATDSQSAMVTIELVVDGEELSDETQEVEIEEGDLLLDVMKANYDVEEEDGFVSSINGHTQNPDENMWWTFTVNGEFGEVGAAEYELEPGDTIQWTLEAFE